MPTIEEAFSNPLAPPTVEVVAEESKPQRLTNADFRKLMMTPRAPSSTSSKDSASVSSTLGSSKPASETVPKTTDGTSSDKASERKKKKSYYALIKKEEGRKMAELAEKYRDRARERRDGKNPDYQAEDPTQPGMGAYRAVAPDLKSGIDAAERRRQLIQESKFLGGDMEHTHLVKGLDYALLQKVRSEITIKEQEVEVVEKQPAGTEEQQQQQQPQQPQPPPATPVVEKKQTVVEEEEMEFKSNAGRRIFHSIFHNNPPEFNDNFLPGRLAYSIDLEDEADSDIPITVLRSKSDIVDIDSMQATFTTNDIVIQKLTQILSYLRTGRASKKQRKKDKGKEPAGGKPQDESIYGEIGEYAPNVNKNDKERERGRDRRDRRDRDKDRPGREGRSYFDRPPQEQIQNDATAAQTQLESHWNQLSDRNKSVADAALDSQETQAKATMGFGTGIVDALANKSQGEVDYYTECYPGKTEMQDAIEDSEDEADYTKMDLGNKKGPVGRWDFDTQEEYSSYMNQREALPKAAFQYGVKMADGRKTRRIGGNKEKDRNAELNREWQQIQKILKRRKDTDIIGQGDKRARYNY